MGGVLAGERGRRSGPVLIQGKQPADVWLEREGEGGGG